MSKSETAKLNKWKINPIDKLGQEISITISGLSRCKKNIPLIQIQIFRMTKIKFCLSKTLDNFVYIYFYKNIAILLCELKDKP